MPVKVGVSKRDIIEQGASLSPSPLVDSHDTSIPDNLLSVDIRVHGHRLNFHLHDVLYYGRSDAEDLTDIEIDKSLDAISEYRISIGVAHAHIKAQIEEVEKQILMFEMDNLDRAAERVMEKKKAARQSRVTEETLRATHDEKFAEMLKDSGTRVTWSELKSNLTNLKRDALILKHVDQVLESRTTALIGISKRRFAERTKLFQD